MSYRLTCSPIVSGTASMFRNVEVLRVVQILIRSSLNPIDNSGLQIDQESPRDVVLIVSLVEKDIFAVVSLNGKIFQDSLRADAVLLAQVLPEFVSDYT